MSIEQHVQDNYNGYVTWFEEEVKQAHHINRIAKIIENKNYLSRIHKILNKLNIKWKGQEYTTAKTIYNTLKGVCEYHTCYTVGKSVSLIGSKEILKEFNKIYRNGHFDENDFDITDKVLKYGDCGEYLYTDNGIIKSYIIESEDFYPVYDELNNYVACIEHWTDALTNISHYVVYYPNKVERWNNESSDLHLIDIKNNEFGLPIHHHNKNEIDKCFGESILEDSKPLMNDFESFLNKLSDAIYTLSINPIGVLIGAQNASSVMPDDAVGVVIELSAGGDFKFSNAQMDYNSIKLYLDNLLRNINQVCYMPNVMNGQSNIANVSETVIKIIYDQTDAFSLINQRWIKKGIRERFDKIKTYLAKKGIVFEDDFVDVSFNVNRPINESELVENITRSVELGYMSLQTAMERNPLIIDIEQEMSRLESERQSKKKINDNNSDGEEDKRELKE